MGYVCICVKVWEDVHVCVHAWIYVHMCLVYVFMRVCVLAHEHSGV